MLTVTDALLLEQFNGAGARLIAGANGAYKNITWVHIASVPDAPQFLHGGELALTTIRNMPAEPGEQCQYVQSMADKGVAGLVMTVGRFISEIPLYLREVADLNNFPLIEIPYTAPFIDIAKATNERIAEESMAMITGALTIHQVLTQLVLDGGDLKQLAVRLAGLLGQSISIENERFEIVASANVDEVDEARRFTMSEGRTNPRLLEALEERGILRQIKQTLRPVLIPQMPDVGLEFERILAPIVVHGDIYGYVWIISHNRPLTDLDRVAITSGATIAALMMLYQESLQNAEASLKGSLLSQLIQAEPGREAVLTDQALRYGFDLTRPFLMLLLECPDRSTQRVLQIYRRVNRLAAIKGWAAVVGQFAGQVVVLAQGNQKTETLVEQILTEMSGSHKMRIGVSGLQRGAGSVGLAHQQCREVLLIAQRLGDHRQAAYFDHLGYLHALYRAGASSLDTNPYVPIVRRLLNEHQTDLFNTLEAYLDAGGNGMQTAHTLHIHRSTLNYRLARIVELCNVDLSDPTLRLNLQVALKLLRLFEVE